MFERFTKQAQEVVTVAHDEALALAGDAVGAEHLLLGYVVRVHPAGWPLPPHGMGPVWLGEMPRTISADDIRAAIVDEESRALAELGISLDAVRERVEQTLGADVWHGARLRRRLPFTPAAKRALELALREALDLRQRRLTAEHVLLGALAQERVRTLLHGLGFEPEELRAHVRSVLAEVRVMATR